MEWNKKLLNFLEPDGQIEYDGIKLDLTRQTLEDWVFQTEEHPSVLILHYWSKVTSQIRNKKINSVLQKP